MAAKQHDAAAAAARLYARLPREGRDLKREAAKAQAQRGKGLEAKNRARAQATDRRIRRRDPAHRRRGFGAEPAQNAEAANAQLAQGLHDIAAGTRAASAKIANLKSVGAAIAYLEHSKGPVKGSREVYQGSRDAAEARVHDRQLSTEPL